MANKLSAILIRVEKTIVRPKRKIPSIYNLSFFSRLEIIEFEKEIAEEIYVISFNGKEIKIKKEDLEGERNLFGPSFYSVKREKTGLSHEEFPYNELQIAA